MRARRNHPSPSLSRRRALADREVPGPIPAAARDVVVSRARRLFLVGVRPGVSRAVFQRERRGVFGARKSPPRGCDVLRERVTARIPSLRAAPRAKRRRAGRRAAARRPVHQSSHVANVASVARVHRRDRAVARDGRKPRASHATRLRRRSELRRLDDEVRDGGSKRRRREPNRHDHLTVRGDHPAFGIDRERPRGGVQSGVKLERDGYFASQGDARDVFGADGAKTEIHRRGTPSRSSRGRRAAGRGGSRPRRGRGRNRSSSGVRWGKIGRRRVRSCRARRARGGNTRRGKTGWMGAPRGSGARRARCW